MSTIMNIAASIITVASAVAIIREKKKQKADAARRENIINALRTAMENGSARIKTGVIRTDVEENVTYVNFRKQA